MRIYATQGDILVPYMYKWYNSFACIASYRVSRHRELSRWKKKRGPEESAVLKNALHPLSNWQLQI